MRLPTASPYPPTVRRFMAFLGFATVVSVVIEVEACSDCTFTLLSCPEAVSANAHRIMLKKSVLNKCFTAVSVLCVNFLQN